METAVWVSAHYEEPFHSRRVAKLPTKLAKLGVLNLSRTSRILDTCCGKGEALAVLGKYGFTNLVGADGFWHREWGQIAGSRFAVCDVRQLPFPDNEFDAILNLHSLHHMGNSRGVAEFLAECFRVLKPGGKLFILDFPGSFQIKALFWVLRRRLGVVTPGLRNFAQIVDEEWSYLSTYLGDWQETQALLGRGPLQMVQWRRDVFLYYVTLSKTTAN